MSRSRRRTFREAFKTQIVNLYLSGKENSEIFRESDLRVVNLNVWIAQHQFSGSFKENNYLTPEEKGFIELLKSN